MKTVLNKNDLVSGSLDRQRLLYTKLEKVYTSILYTCTIYFGKSFEKKAYGTKKVSYVMNCEKTPSCRNAISWW